jgi:hypothetical protein
MVVILVANLFTIAAVSYCFLDTTGKTHASCRIFPGYQNALDTGNERLARFQLLLGEIKKNKQEVKILKLQVKELENANR